MCVFLSTPLGISDLLFFEGPRQKVYVVVYKRFPSVTQRGPSAIPETVPKVLLCIVGLSTRRGWDRGVSRLYIV